MKIIEEVLPSSGLRVITVPLRKGEDVVVGVYIKVGSRCEDENTNGLSHFLEHMLFRGPDALHMYRTLDSLGADYNAVTNDESTSYFIQINHRHLETALSFLSDMLLRPSFTAEDVEIERGAVLQELYGCLDTPSDPLLIDWQKLVFNGQPVGFESGGLVENVKSFTYEDLMGFWERFYFPKNMVVVVAGKVTGSASAKVGDTFYFKGRKSNSKKVWLPFQKITTRQERVSIQERQMNQVQFMLGGLAPSARDDLLYATEVLCEILGGSGFSSRLFLSVRERRGLAYSVFTWHCPYYDTGYFSTDIGVDPKNIDVAANLVIEEYRRIYENGVTAEELKRAKEVIEARDRRDYRDLIFLADFLGDYELTHNDVATPEEILEELRLVGLEEVHKAARRILAPENLVMAAIGPFSAVDRRRLEGLLKY